MEALFVRVAGESPITQGLVAGIFITLMNALGALLVLLMRRPSDRLLDASLGFAAGVMLTASFTSLILPGIEYGGLLPVLIGLIVGIAVLDLTDHFVPHMHQRFIGYEGVPSKRVKSVWLLIIAITIHNAPEGLAVGVGFGAGDLPQALKLMLAIGFQNIPEGLAASAGALSVGIGARWFAVYIGVRAGLVEIPLALFGATAVYLMSPLLPYAMGFAAGAMLYVVSDEIVPETHRKGHERWATFGTMLGVMVMLTLDVAFG